MVITFLTMYNKSQFFYKTGELKIYKSKYFTGKKYKQENPAYVQ